MKEKARRLCAALKETITAVHRRKATEILLFELSEMENIFALLVLGSFIGIPSPNPILTLELLPHMEEELWTMVSRADFAQDPLGGLISLLELD